MNDSGYHGDVYRGITMVWKLTSKNKQLLFLISWHLFIYFILLLKNTFKV